MTKMTRRTNHVIVVEVVDLDISCIYSHNHMVRMNKISSNATSDFSSITTNCNCSYRHVSLFNESDDKFCKLDKDC
jgi:hypothetical protein